MPLCRKPTRFCRSLTRHLFSLLQSLQQVAVCQFGNRVMRTQLNLRNCPRVRFILEYLFLSLTLN